MLKFVVVAGIIFFVVGASSFIYSTFSSYTLTTVFDDRDILDAYSYHMYMNNVVKPGNEVYSEYSASDDIEFFILDSENYELFVEKYKKGEQPIFYAIYRSFGNSDSYTFNPSAGEYYAILLNDGDNDVSFSFKQLEEYYFVKDTTLAVSLLLIPFGFFFLIGGLIQKPKKVEIP